VHSDRKTSFVPWWCAHIDEDVEQELIHGLRSADPTERLLAEAWLIENGETSMSFLEDALAAGTVTPWLAGPCMAEILRRKIWGDNRSPSRWLVMEVSCC
jgi:hypothetical protein